MHSVRDRTRRCARLALSTLVGVLLGGCASSSEPPDDPFADLPDRASAPPVDPQPKRTDSAVLNPASPSGRTTAKGVAPAACKTATDAVSTVYEMALLRAPAEAELAHWLFELERGGQRLDMLRTIIRSTEFIEVRSPQSDADFMQGLYSGFLGRASDSDGLAYWMSELARQMPRSNVALSFVDSTEFRRTNEPTGCFF